MVNLRIFPLLDGVIGYDDGSLFLIAPYPTFADDVGEPIFSAKISAVPLYGTRLSAQAEYIGSVSKQP